MQIRPSAELLGRKEKVVLLITGHGLKDVDAAMSTIRIPAAIEPTVEALDSVSARTS